MKIGIITVHNSPNYGACLQSYGLFHYLCNVGYDCEIIDLHRPTHSDYVKSKIYTLARPRRQKKSSPIRVLLHKLFCRDKKSIMSVEAQKRFENFNSRINLSRSYTGIDALYMNPPSYDVYISGSDQLWNPTIGFCNEPYFLTFVKNYGKKISYATSIGIEHLYDNEKANYAKWLDSYSHISVRENSAKQLLESFIDNEVTQVADPSFLPDRNHWKSLSVAPTLGMPYILLFTLSYSEVLLQFAKRLKQATGKELVYLCLKQPEEQKDYIVEKNAGPQEWLGYIANAEMVITDSFHGTVFSIIMDAKNFFTYVPSTQKRGKRMIDLLETFQLSSHIFTERDLDKSVREYVDQELNHVNISEIYLAEQQRSREYLTEAINN